jgi:riboflavin kinase/FMN adenylyltransferase
MMVVYNDIDSFTKLPNGVTTIGIFDGVHIGHQKILKSLVEEAKKVGGESVVVTFWPHPRLVLANDTSLKLINSIAEKINLIAELGVDHLIVIPFTREFADLSAEKFSKEYLADKIGTKILFVGYDHRFGKNKEGSFDYLKDHAHLYGFEVKEIPSQDIDNLSVSSTRIREAIETGDLDIANELLGRVYSLEGIVVKGRQMGRQLGFPTANIAIALENKILPFFGVYAVRVELHKKAYYGMLNIGIKPSFENLGPTIEVHIFDFQEDIYGEAIKISFVKRIRDEQKFASIEDLKQQLVQDKMDCFHVFELV